MPWFDTPCETHGRTVRISTPEARKIIEAKMGIVFPAGSIVMHLCDNPLCGNPEHLQLGTQSDNLRDAFIKGHLRGSIHRPGELHRFHKLSAQDVFDIRRKYQEGKTQPELSKIYNINQSTVCRAINGKRWKVLGGA